MKKVLYLIGSLRNKRIPELASRLRKECPDVEVFDDWFAAGPEADDWWKKYEQEKGNDYTKALSGYAAKHVFDFDRHHLDRSTHTLLALPAGKSGHMEAMYACYGVGCNTAILLDPEDVRWDVMYQFIPTILNDDSEIKDWLMTEEEFWGRPMKERKIDSSEVRRGKAPNGPTTDSPPRRNCKCADVRSEEIRRPQLARGLQDIPPRRGGTTPFDGL